ncbi:DUF6270 domain-containing protein [Priestia megaterium]
MNLKKKIDILGSCVSRDPFAMFDHQYEINEYFARTNIISLASKPVGLSIRGIHIESKFQRRSVYNDLNKLFLKHVDEEPADTLIIDLLSERLRLMKRGESYIALSKEFAQSNLMNDLKSKRIVERTDELWESSADKICERINASSISKIIIHKAFWKEKYVDKEGNVQVFENQDEILRHNQQLEYMYTYLGNKINNSTYLEIKEEFMADENHKWGLTPRHYQPAYYERFLEQLNALLLPVVAN